MSDDFHLLTYLKSHYPNVPITTVLKVINRCDHDQERCREALEEERKRYPDSGEEPPGQANNTQGQSVSASASPSTMDRRNVTQHMKELHVSHEGLSTPGGQQQEIHVSTIERPVGGHRTEVKRPAVGQSISWTVQTPENVQVSSANRPSGQPAVPQTAPADFNSFIFTSSPNDIPNIDCKTSGSNTPGSGNNTHKPHQMPGSAVSSSRGSPSMEQRRPVKVINIPAGSLSGGSVSGSVAMSQSNSRHYRMHFGDTGGVCTVAAPPPSMKPNVRNETQAELLPQQGPVHSSTCVVMVNTPNQLAASAGHPYNGRRTPNPPSATTSPIDHAPPFNAFGNKPLSTPVQASSPGISHSKPIFGTRNQPAAMGGGEVAAGFNDPSYPPPPPTSVVNTYSPPQASNVAYNPSHPPFMPPYNMDHANQAVMGGGYHPPSTVPQHMLPGYRGLPYNMYVPSVNNSFEGQQPFGQHNAAAYPGAVAKYPGYPAGSQYGHPPFQQHSGMPVVGNRSNSQESSDADSHNAMGSRVSSQSSVSSESSTVAERLDPSVRPRTGSLQENTDYISTLLDHQSLAFQKLRESTDQQREMASRLRHEVTQLEREKIESGHLRSIPSDEDFARMREKICQLQTNIQMYMNEMEMAKSGQPSVNHTNPVVQQNFYENMPTGQQDPIYSRSPGGQHVVAASSQPTPPPRPPPPIPVRQRSSDQQAGGGAVGGVMSGDMISRVVPAPGPQGTIHSGDSEEGEPWSCAACTFSNHPALTKCEICELPRSKAPANSPPPPALPPHQPITASVPPPRLAPSGRSQPPPPLGHQHRAVQ